MAANVLPDVGAVDDVGSLADAGAGDATETLLDASFDAGPVDPCVVPGLTTRICDDFDRTTPRPAPSKAPWGTNVAGTTIVVDDVTRPSSESRRHDRRRPS